MASYTSAVIALTPRSAAISRVGRRENAMSPTPKTPRPQAARREGTRAERRKGLQPAPTGANRGSPAAPVMQQFVKTKAERNGGR